MYNNNFVDVINDLSIGCMAMHARNFILNAFNAHYAETYAGIIGTSIPFR